MADAALLPEEAAFLRADPRCARPGCGHLAVLHIGHACEVGCGCGAFVAPLASPPARPLSLLHHPTLELSPLDTCRLATLLRTLLPMLAAEQRVASAALAQSGPLQLDAMTPRRTLLLQHLRETLAVLDAVLATPQG